VLCTGFGRYGQLGTGGGGFGFESYYVMMMTPVSGLGSGASRIICGFDHSCALLLDGSIKCWGRGEDGQVRLWSVISLLIVDIFSFDNFIGMFDIFVKFGKAYIWRDLICSFFSLERSVSMLFCYLFCFDFRRIGFNLIS
jgi:hypothetical protein